MGQSICFTPVPAGFSGRGIGYGETSSQVISGAVSATSSHRDSGRSCLRFLMSSACGSAAIGGEDVA